MSQRDPAAFSDESYWDEQINVTKRRWSNNVSRQVFLFTYSRMHTHTHIKHETFAHCFQLFEDMKFGFPAFFIQGAYSFTGEQGEFILNNK